jgi:peptide deformylase
MMKIVTVPHSILSTVAKPVPKIDKRIIRLVKEMEEILAAQKNPEGVGISAPQVALDLRIFIVKHPADKVLKTFINPEFLKMEYLPKPKTKKKKDDQDEEYEDSNLEGCLSIPNIWAEVKRFDRVLVRYIELDGSTKEEWFTGFQSVVVQHEYDHLEGILFTQRAIEQGNPLYREVKGKLREIEFV